jgi:ketosteroid isomerase-like protein
MLARDAWQELEGLILEEKIRVRELLCADRDGLFAAEPVEASGFEPPCPIVVRFLRDNGRGEPLLDRFLEASFFDHPNLLRCFGAGLLERGSVRFIYVALEREDATLADYLRTVALPPSEARSLGLDLAAGLAYLHERNLVYCNLDPASVARVGNAWKLSDYSQMRVVGNNYAAETRRLMAVTPSTPPEAYEGVVSPSWDVWSLACVLTAALSGPKSEDSLASRRQRPDLPPPFASITAECLNTNPQERCGLDRIRQLLEQFTEEAPAQRLKPAFAGAPGVQEPAVRRHIPEQLSPARDGGPGGALPAAHVVMNPYEAARERARARHGRSWLLYAVATGAAMGILLAALFFRDAPPRDVSAGGARDHGVAASAPANAAPATPAPNRQQSAGATKGESDRAAPPAADDQTAIRSLLENWAAATRSGDVDAQVSFYAPIVDRYYGQRNVPRERIRRERQQALEKLGDVRQYEISNIYVQLTSPNTAVATFDKAWDFGSAKGSYGGKVKQQVSLRKMDGVWRIASERDIHVYRRSRSGPSRS